MSGEKQENCIAPSQDWAEPSKYVRTADTITLGDSFRDSWGFESDIIARIRDRKGELFPRSNRRDIVRDSNFKSGLERYRWMLIDTTNRDFETIADQRYAMKQTNKNGDEYYLISRFSA